MGSQGGSPARIVIGVVGGPLQEIEWHDDTTLDIPVDRAPRTSTSDDTRSRLQHDCGIRKRYDDGLYYLNFQTTARMTDQLQLTN